MQRTKNLTPEQLPQIHSKDGDPEGKTNAEPAAQNPRVIGVNPFDSLPCDVVVKIANKYLHRSDERRFANTCRSLFWEKKLIPVTRKASNAVHRFLVHVKNGNLNSATMMLDYDPGLIIEQHSVGEHQQVTALLLAKRMYDIGMCRILLDRLHKFDALYRTNHAHLQIESVARNVFKKKPIDLKIFDHAADAIARYQSDVTAELARHHHPDQQKTNLSDAMDAYRKSCDDHGEFSAEDLKSVFKALSRNDVKFKTLDQYNLFFLQVVGYAERKVSLWLRMALNNATRYKSKHNIVANCARISTCRIINDDYSHVDYPLDTFAPNAGLGFDFAFDSEGGSKEVIVTTDFNKCAKEFEKLCQLTESEIVKLFQLNSEPEPQTEEVKPASRCVIF